MEKTFFFIILHFNKRSKKTFSGSVFGSCEFGDGKQTRKSEKKKNFAERAAQKSDENL
jgi:hypothetical protein